LDLYSPTAPGWDTKEKEMVAHSLVDMVGRASAANILGITVRELDKLVEIYDLSLKLTDLAEPGASIPNGIPPSRKKREKGGATPNWESI
jgi:hypothetical protein